MKYCFAFSSCLAFSNETATLNRNAGVRLVLVGGQEALRRGGVFAAHEQFCADSNASFAAPSDLSGVVSSAAGGGRRGDRPAPKPGTMQRPRGGRGAAASISSSAIRRHNPDPNQDPRRSGLIQRRDSQGVGLMRARQRLHCPLCIVESRVLAVAPLPPRRSSPPSSTREALRRPLGVGAASFLRLAAAPHGRSSAASEMPAASVASAHHRRKRARPFCPAHPPPALLAQPPDRLVAAAAAPRRSSRRVPSLLVSLGRARSRSKHRGSERGSSGPRSRTRARGPAPRNLRGQPFPLVAPFRLAARSPGQRTRLAIEGHATSPTAASSSRRRPPPSRRTPSPATAFTCAPAACAGSPAPRTRAAAP